MTKVLQLNEPDARKAYNEGDAKEKALLARLYPTVFGNIMDRVTTLADVFAETGENAADYVVTSTATRRQKKRITGDLLDLIYEVFQQDWIADFSDGSQRKYRAYHEYSPGSGFVLLGVHYGYTHACVGARHVLPSEELIRHIYKYFLPQINAYLEAQ